jgi:hypothetical protein
MNGPAEPTPHRGITVHADVEPGTSWQNGLHGHDWPTVDTSGPPMAPYRPGQQRLAIHGPEPLLAQAALTLAAHALITAVSVFDQDEMEITPSWSLDLGEVEVQTGPATWTAGFAQSPVARAGQRMVLVALRDASYVVAHPDKVRPAHGT